VIDILLATYNAEKYLEELLDSLFCQTFQDFRLVVRDDGSSDSTDKLLKKWEKEYPDKIKIVTDEKGNLGPAGSFSELMSHSSADYIMFCDHDDVWMKDKISASLKKIKEMEEDYGKEHPLLVHTDLNVTDSRLENSKGSFFRFQALNPEKGESLKKLLVQNSVTGCTVIINRALKNFVSEIPPCALMHDWWLALAAAASGHIGRIDEMTIFYRQHESNQVGAKGFALLSALKRLSGGGVSDAVQNLFEQAVCFHDYYHDKLDEKSLKTISRFIEIRDMGFFEKRIRILKDGYLKYGFLRNAAMLMVL